MTMIVGRMMAKRDMPNGGRPPVWTPAPRQSRASVGRYRRLQKFCRGGFTDRESVTAAVKDIKGACDELERAVRKRKIWVTSRRLFSFAQIVLGAALTPISPVAIGLVIAGLGQFTATEMLSNPEKPQLQAPDLAMLLDVQHELDLGT
jgi:hypothetical protein